MDVLVCATQVPFMRGGLEMMVENLVDALRNAGHRAEAVQVPAAWDRDRLLDAATAWRMVPLDADVVIPVNFPAYYARHPRKVLWLAHQHRAAYDGLGQPWSDIGARRRQPGDAPPGRRLGHPGAGGVHSRFTISGVVAERMRTYNGLTATPLYQPPPLADRIKPRPGGVGSHILCPTRLEANKRPGLFLDAIASMRKPVDGILAGKGSLADELQASTERLGPRRAGQLPRVRVRRRAGRAVPPGHGGGLRPLRRGLRLRHAPGVPRRRPRGDHRRQRRRPRVGGARGDRPGHRRHRPTPWARRSTAWSRDPMLAKRLGAAGGSG